MTNPKGGNSKILFIGIGNKYRSDDGVGLIIADSLRKKDSCRHVTISKQDGEAAALIESWEGFDIIIIADATFSTTPPGTISRFDVKEKSLKQDIFNYSTHSFSIADAVELGRALNKLPDVLIVYGIEGENFSYGCALSPDVQKSISNAVELIIKDISKLGEQYA